MKVIRGIRPDLLPASVVTLGMFDGVHRGHQALLQTCRTQAAQVHLPAVALTYEPHPSVILRPDHPIALLTTMPEKLEHLARWGMDVVVIPEFTLEFSQLPADRFLHEVLVAALHPQVVVAGYRTTFGHAREGTAAVLRDAGVALGFAVDIVEPIEVAGGPVSSTRIRQALEAGEIALATELLGYRYQLSGLVTHGDGRGHQIGVPTANLTTPPEKLIPADGVYAVEASAPGVTRRAVMNIGKRPTFNRPYSLEVHLLDYHADLYGQPLTVTFLARLRETRPFDSQESLLAQIRADIALARAIV
ncbi:MAG TPA: bifunctional riboflavin kinase/FAD synthetase [Armatimonadota bacterium]|jgi:riboflavin kinase/FMN adenylyltransferase